MRLTDKNVVGLTVPVGRNEIIQYDDELPGFGLRLRAGGSARWVYTYKIGTQHRRITIGSPSSLTAARARSTAADLHAKIRLGTDPASEKIENRIRASETMGAVLPAYLAQKRTELRPGSFNIIELQLVKHCRHLHGLQLAKIDQRTIATTLNTVAEHGATPNRTRSALSSFFTWCMRDGLLTQNPVLGTNRRQEKPRDRVLTGEELKVIWKETADEHDFSAIVRLLMLTGCRRTEIGALRWSEVFGDRIVLPAERTKNGRALIVPLSEPAKAILANRPRDGEFVFGRWTERPFGGWDRCTKRLADKIKIAPWRIHDLRRTVATGMAEIGVAPHIIEAVLNHVSGAKAGVAGIYNRAAYEPEKRKALTRWAKHLLATVEGRKAPKKTANVVQLRSA